MPADAMPGYRPGVGIMLMNREGRIFVGRRIDVKDTPAWQMPQGGIDPGESPRAAALRELKEEIGTASAEILAESREWRHYDIPVGITANLWGGRYRGQRQKWFLMRFLGSDAEIDLATPHPEFDAWQWVEPDALPRLIIPFKRPLYRDVLAEFRALCGGTGGG
ncbi:MAG TPA: RNA pyrophosphohydrolase [Stellaceae bacterium]|nr:RNA pyrophosphohydrolase [Stellaceae bacterium]